MNRFLIIPMFCFLLGANVYGSFNNDSGEDFTENSHFHYFDIDWSDDGALDNAIESLRSSDPCMLEVSFEETAKSDLQKMVDRLSITGLKLFDIESDAIDSVLTIVSPLPLRILHLDENHLINEKMDFVKNFRELKELGLYYNNLTCHGLSKLISLEKLEKLNLSCNYIEDEGIKFLSNGLPNLVCLKVGACKLTDDCFQHVKKMGSLRRLDISGNESITRDAVKAFREQRPDVTLVSDFLQD